MNKTAPLLLVIPALLALTGCTDSTLKQTYLEDTYVDRAPTGTMDAANNAYQAGDYSTAYTIARPIADDYLNPRHLEAAYVAGLSAHQLGDLRNAGWLLRKAMTTQDLSLKADAAAQLGLVYSAQGRYAEAERSLLWAAEQLSGESKAQAFYYAGIAQQKQGQWSQARATLYNALRHTSNPATQRQVNDQIATAGWTLQVGAFTQRSFADDAAQRVADDATRMGLGAPRLVESRDADGRPLTLVQVGTFMSYQSAARFRDNLGTAVIIKPITQ
ncbi:MAG: SPOR domain-containing protein [Planctomycetota bacterium]